MEQWEATCSVCGKKFFIKKKSQYLYKTKIQCGSHKYQCCYSCHQEERKKIKNVRRIV